MKTTLVILFCAALLRPCFGDQPEWAYGDYNNCKAELAKFPSDRDGGQLRSCFGLKQNLTRFARLAAGRQGYAKFLQAIENARLDKQVGASAGSDGSANIVSKGAVPQTLAFAVENGAIARTQQGTTLTYRANLGGMARLITGGDAVPYCTVVDTLCPILTRVVDALSAAVTFDPSRTTPQGTGSQSASSLLFTGQGRQISSWTARFDWHTRPKAGFQAQWQNAVSDTGMRGAAAQVLKDLGTVLEDFRNTPESGYQAWEDSLTDKLQSDAAATTEQARLIVVLAANDLIPIAKSYIDKKAKADSKQPDFDTYIGTVVQSYGTFLGTRDRILDAAINPITFALEYVQDRPVAQPALSTVRFVFSDRPTGSDKALITVNAAAEFYDQLPSGTGHGRLRDGQAAVQFDRAVGSLAHFNTTLSAGYYWQYMKDNAILTIPAGTMAPNTVITLPGDAAALLGTKGSIHIGQAKMTFKMKNTGVSIPIALTVSNRSELVLGNRIGGSVGVMFDLDSLLAKAK
jgi:hypothetical protein